MLTLCARGSSGEDLIQRAGNAASDAERLRLLRELRAKPDLDDALAKDLDTLLPAIEQWVGKTPGDTSGRAAENSYLCRFFNKRPDRYPPDLRAGSPLLPIHGFYRGRALVWKVIESGGIYSREKMRDDYYGRAHRAFEAAHRAHPENPIVRMYLGESLPWPRAIAADPRAPEWANLQRDALEKLADIIHWWIANRQLPDGQFGGGWGDDCEMWRWWTPVLIAFHDPAIAAAQEKLSRGLLGLPTHRDGYTSRVSDVEHTAEDTADTITPMMHLSPGDPEWRRRALRLAELMRDRWTGRNERGFLQFKSTYFSVDRVDTKPQRACDTVYHPRTVQPTLLLWQRTCDPELTRLFAPWMDTWADAAARAERGKPAGIVPTAIHWPDGRVGGTGKRWWMPENYGTPLYDWPSAMSMMVDTLLLTHHITGQDRYLEPIRSMARIRADFLATRPGETPKPGSQAWCAMRMKSFLAPTLAKYRVLTGDRSFDPLLRTDARPYVAFRLFGDRSRLVEGLRRTAAAFRVNWPGYTSEVRYTDRVLRFASKYLVHVGHEKPTPDPGLLYSSASGDPGGPLYFPMNAVRWLTPPRAIAALVTDAGTDRLAAELYHFGDQPRTMAAELFLLKPGRYALTFAGTTRAIEVTGATTRIDLALPPGKLCTLGVLLEEPR
jgi:hypothetical protein